MPSLLTVNLDAINRLDPLPWPLRFSYGRALQGLALRQDALLECARLNSAACQGRYTAAIEAAGQGSRLR